MRTVKFKVYQRSEGDRPGGWFESTGKFHQWGVTSIEIGETCATDTVAIVETEDGKIYQVYPTCLEFTS